MQHVFVILPDYPSENVVWYSFMHFNSNVHYKVTNAIPFSNAYTCTCTSCFWETMRMFLFTFRLNKMELAIAINFIF